MLVSNKGPRNCGLLWSMHMTDHQTRQRTRISRKSPLTMVPTSGHGRAKRMTRVRLPHPAEFYVVVCAGWEYNKDRVEDRVRGRVRIPEEKGPFRRLAWFGWGYPIYPYLSMLNSGWGRCLWAHGNFCDARRLSPLGAPTVRVS